MHRDTDIRTDRQMEHMRTCTTDRRQTERWRDRQIDRHKKDRDGLTVDMRTVRLRDRQTMNVET